jgi:hypothetical protein
MCEESVVNLVLCEPIGSSFSTPGFTPGSLPVLLPVPDRTQSHSITVLGTKYADLAAG